MKKQILILLAVSLFGVCVFAAPERITNQAGKAEKEKVEKFKKNVQKLKDQDVDAIATLADAKAYMKVQNAVINALVDYISKMKD